jgi:DNA helicase-2/ATP-dependent DNA helicase PcrA
VRKNKKVGIMTDLMEGLNPEQREAVLHMDGPCMVLAGAGSGKTRVLTRRIAQLIDNGVRANQILAITFTNKAAHEMRRRVAELIPDFNGRWIQTFHAACYKILRMDIEHLGYERNFTIIDDGDARQSLKVLIKANNDYESKPEELLYVIKRAKNSMSDLNRHYADLKVPAFKKEIYQAYHQEYQQHLKAVNALDFEDMLLLTIKLFERFPEVLAKYQDKLRYVMIDEFQDTNNPQYQLMQMLSGERANIFVVGDPDQSIYSWRGAEPRNSRRFLEEYPQARVIKLETNYRSSGNILQAANQVINCNTDRVDKTLRSSRGDGEQLVEFCALDSYQEASFVAQRLAELRMEESRPYNDFAVFYRSHVQSRQIEEALRLKGIPYQIIGAHNFYERKEIKDMIAYLRIICNPYDRLSFSRVINVPKRGVGDKTIDKIHEYALAESISLVEALAEPSGIPGISKKVVAALTDFCSMVTYISSLNDAGEPINSIIQHVLDMSGYLEELYHSKDLDAAGRIENLKEFQSLAVEFEQAESEELTEPEEEAEAAGLVKFLAHISLVPDNEGVDGEDVVTLMTFHGAKGLEFPVVFMTGMEEGVFPSYRVETTEEMEEERRICYVGITRAQERLFLTYALNRLLYGHEHSNPPSRFLKEIPEELLFRPRLNTREGFIDEEFAIGERVLHRKFGVGEVVTSVGDGLVIIDFGHWGVKTLRIDIAPLMRITE